MKKIAIVCLYGLMDEKLRHETEYFGYRSYLRHVCSYLNQLENLQMVVLCGGKTNGPDLPAESDSVLPFVRGLIDTYTLVFCERNSRNTPQNLYLAMKHFIAGDREYDGVDGDIIVCVDKVRQFKTKIIARQLADWHPCCQRLKDAKVVGFERMDIHPHSNPRYQFMAAMEYFLSGIFNIFDNGNTRLEIDLNA